MFDVFEFVEENVGKLVVTFEPIMQFCCPSRFRIFKPYLPTLFYEREKRQKKLLPVAVIDTYF